MEIALICEMSGTCRDAFTALGHNAISIDLMETLSPGQHYKGDIFPWAYGKKFDIAIMFPPCTYLTRSNNKAMTFGCKEYDAVEAATRQRQAVGFVKKLWKEVNATGKALENPVGVLSTQWMKPSQIIHPWQYGHPEKKETCLWLHNLPLLHPTNIVYDRQHKIWLMGQRKDRAIKRSLTFPGIASAMADQWTNVKCKQLNLFQ